MAAHHVGDPTQQLWDETLSRLVHLSSSMLKRNADLEQRVAELEVELHVWKQAHSVALEASEAHNVQIAALNRQISGLDYFKSNQNPLILCVINGDELVFNRDLLSQGFQGGRLAAQEITKAIAEHLTKEEVQVYGRLSFWITLYFNKADLLEAVLSNGVCTHEHFEAFYAGFSQSSARFSVVDAGYSKDSVEAKIKEYLQTYTRFPQTIRVFFGGYDPSVYTTIFNTLEQDHLLGKIALLCSGQEVSPIDQPQHPFSRLRLDGLFMAERLPRGSRTKLSPLSTNHFGVSNGGLISPTSPERIAGRVIDPTLPLHKQNPPPCNEHYLMSCSKGGGICKYSHDYILTAEQLNQLANNAKKAPCNWLKNGVPCPYGDKCCWGHVCPNGPKCFHLSKGKCWFKGEAMHPELTPSTPVS